MIFTFPANTGSPGFSLEVDTRAYVPESSFVTLRLYQEVLYLHGGVGGTEKLAALRILGWHRQPFPLCCGLDTVHDLYSLWPEEIMEKWWEWMKGIRPILKPAIGIIPQLIDQQNNAIALDRTYSWYASKGVQWGNPIKNVNYPNHQLIPYLFFPAKGIEQILKPTFGMINQAL